MNDLLKEMKKILEDIASDVESLSGKEISPKPRASRPESGGKAYLESVIRAECAEIKRMITQIDNQAIADSVSKAVVNRLMSPLQEAIGSAMKGKPVRSIGMIAEDMKRKVERLSDRHIRVIRCISQANGEWVNYDYLSGVCRLSQSCIRGYVSDLKRVYEIPIETSFKSGKMHVRMDPQTIKRLALGYQAAKIDAT